jgi:hypothetical protein
LFRALLHFFLILVAAATPAFAQVYKWVDERGVTHYGERPPQGSKAREVPNKLGSPAPGSADSREISPPKDRDPGEGSSREPRDAPADKQKEEAARRQEQCTQQRELLARLRQSASGYASSGWGPRTSSEHDAAIARQEKLVAEQCRS